ncbi:aldo/keto reductase [Blastopirellula marina]|uniref:Aldo/keto reductase n=1 Tax=Blastopirellula marina TaxID=124 RepID=A0A2S8F1Q3_9BACT|nr:MULTISPECIES: aldo/keto reductase [Pirellulaceae]PQO26096.1 aldo/keto reductase [Blastopirellula marina]RCS44454.1 aldo/keto reductase [Bremerella cremea]
MQTRKLGRTGLDVSLLSIGGLYTSSLAGGVSETKRIMQKAVDLGINAVDTAPAYADSELTLGNAIADLTAPLVITTKLGGRPTPFDPQDANGLRASVEESLRLLGRDHVDILMIHEPDRPQQYPWWSSYDPLDGPVLEVIASLKQAGTIRFSGLAGTTVNEMTYLVQQNKFDVVLTAFNYNALFREADSTVIRSASAREMGIVLGSVMGQGFLTRPHSVSDPHNQVWLADARRQQLEQYVQLLDQSGMSAVELCLRFAIEDPRIHTIPIGCKTIEQLEASVAAVEKGPLPVDVRSRLDEIAALLPYRPYEEPMILPLGKNYHGPGIANMGAAVQVGKLKN